jgi:hypothetical protein
MLPLSRTYECASALSRRNDSWVDRDERNIGNGEANPRMALAQVLNPKSLTSREGVTSKARARGREVARSILAGAYVFGTGARRGLAQALRRIV